ncbi:hypothetical protein J5N97_022308 [Dioscorea zingiberensis]|uniref:Uncharacterized protein n=1 Tax=Dioscorea zingiberensis TaxID=325984 RepID=A0A9D5CAB5_9LILI|nr:hypothetical protein J5N97_022308 [Dioscorea zingiberensis]
MVGMEVGDEDVRAMIRMGGGDERDGVGFDALLKISLLILQRETCEPDRFPSFYFHGGGRGNGGVFDWNPVAAIVELLSKRSVVRDEQRGVEVRWDGESGDCCGSGGAGEAVREMARRTVMLIRGEMDDISDSVEFEKRRRRASLRARKGSAARRPGRRDEATSWISMARRSGTKDKLIKF